MSTNLAERVAAYLDGELSPAEAAQLERQLVSPEVATLLGEELAVREFLHGLSPEAPPSGLNDRLFGAIAAEMRGAEILGADERGAGERNAKIARATQTDRLPRLRALLSGSAWMFRGPLAALAGEGLSGGVSAQMAGAAQMASGFSSLRYIVPFGLGRRAAEPSVATKGSRWSRVTSAALRRVFLGRK